MVTGIVSPTRFDAPPVVARTSELLDVARVIEGDTWLEPDGLFSTFNCLRPTIVNWTCPPTGAKDFTTPPSWVDGVKFFAFLGSTCKAAGYNESEAQSEISRVFDLNESFAVEENFDGAVLNLAPAVVAGTFAPLSALALLEQDAAENYAGAPTIHMSRAIAALLSGQNVLDVGSNGDLKTKLGSKVVAGGGYSSLTMWATGEVTIVRGDKHVEQVFDQVTNEVGTMAERAYIASVDCYSAKVGLAPITATP